MTAQTQSGIRAYGPGKFQTVIDSYVWEVCLYGPDEACGDVEENGVCYSLLKGAFKLDAFADLTADKIASLTPEERERLTTTAGVIVSEDSQGFVTVGWFEEESDLMSQWDDCEAEIRAADVAADRRRG